MNERMRLGLIETDIAGRQAVMLKSIEIGVEKRSITEEVRYLNDKAQLELYGSGNSTFIDENGNVIADPVHPKKSVFDEILKTRPYKEVEEFKTKYMAGINELLDDGIDLCRAKLIMDLRSKDRSQISDSNQSDSMGDGLYDLSTFGNDKLASGTNERIGALLNLIKAGGAFTQEDTKRLLKGERLYDIDGNYLSKPCQSGANSLVKDPETPEASKPDDLATDPETPEASKPDDLATDPETPEASKPDDLATDPETPEASNLGLNVLLTKDEMEEYESRINEIRVSETREFQNYADITAQRRQSGLFRKRIRGVKNPLSGQQKYRNKKITNELVLEAGRELDGVRVRAVNELKDRLLKEGINDADVERKILGFNKLFMAALNAAHGESWVNESQRILKNPNTKRARFYNWWLQQSGVGDIYFGDSRFKGNLKKTALMIGAGAVAGAAGLINPALGFAVGLGSVKFFATDFNRALGGLEFNVVEDAKDGKNKKNSKKGYVIARGNLTNKIVNEQLDQNYLKNAGKSRYVYVGPLGLTREFTRDVEEEARRNRVRLVGTAGHLALGGFGVGVTL